MSVDGSESWNGGRIERRAGAPIGLIAFAILALALVGAGAATNDRNWMIGAMFPAALALMLFIHRDRSFVANFTETEMILGDPSKTTIPYSSIQRLWADGRYVEPGSRDRKPFPFLVQHADDFVRVPSLKSPSSYEVYCFLESFLSPEAGGEVHPDLAEFQERQVALHGPESVWVFCAASRRTPRTLRRRLRAFATALLVAGGAWIVIGALSQSFTRPPWGPVGIGCAFYGLIFMLVSFTSGQLDFRFFKDWKKSCLVLSPRGLALVQGDVSGEMGWRDVLDVQYKPRPDFSRTFLRITPQRAYRGIVLKVKGADLVLPDIYDRPLFVIHGRMLEAVDLRDQAVAAKPKRAPKTVLDELEVVDDLSEP